MKGDVKRNKSESPPLFEERASRDKGITVHVGWASTTIRSIELFKWEWNG